VYFQENEAI